METQSARDLYRSLTVLRLQATRRQGSLSPTSLLWVKHGVPGLTSSYTQGRICLGREDRPDKVYSLETPMDEQFLLKQISARSLLTTFGTMVGVPVSHIEHVWTPDKGVRSFARSELSVLLSSSIRDVRLAAIHVVPALENLWEENPVFEADRKRILSRPQTQKA